MPNGTNFDFADVATANLPPLRDPTAAPTFAPGGRGHGWSSGRFLVKPPPLGSRRPMLPRAIGLQWICRSLTRKAHARQPQRGKPTPSLAFAGRAVALQVADVGIGRPAGDLEPHNPCLDDDPPHPLAGPAHLRRKLEPIGHRPAATDPA